MSNIKKIVCLANSRKNSGRCIAGKEVLANGYGNWIRPVSMRPSAEISEEERRYENGSDPRILDIIDIPVIGAKPGTYQSENYVINASYYWTKTGELPWREIKGLLDPPAPLWTNGDSTYYGLNDRVRVELASKLNNSLMLIEPQNLVIRVQTDGAEFGNPRRRVRAIFTHQSDHYRLIVTDPVVERTLLARPNAEYKLNNTYLCVSLGEPHTDGASTSSWLQSSVNNLCETNARSYIYDRTFHPHY